MSDGWAFLGELNMTELATMAAAQNVHAHRGVPREVLISIVQGESHELRPRQMDLWRDAIFAFVDTHWTQLSPLLSCPMKARQPHACFQCTDVQVSECVVQNHRILLDARNLVRKKRENQT